MDLAVQGLIVGGAVTAGTFIGKTYVLRLPAVVFERLLDGLMLFSGCAMLLAAF